MENLIFMVGDYDGRSQQITPLSHFYTFAGQLHLTLGYTWPYIDHKLADELATSSMKFLEILAGADPDTVTVGTFLKSL